LNNNKCLFVIPRVDTIYNQHGGFHNITFLNALKSEIQYVILSLFSANAELISAIFELIYLLLWERLLCQ